MRHRCLHWSGKYCTWDGVCLRGSVRLSPKEREGLRVAAIEFEKMRILNPFHVFDSVKNSIE